MLYLLIAFIKKFLRPPFLHHLLPVLFRADPIALLKIRGEFPHIGIAALFRNMIQIIRGQKVLDVGTGTGVLPRNLYEFGADCSFDVITACQCFWYFNYDVVSPAFARMLKPDGWLVLLYMAWLPCEDKIAGASEKLVLKYSPFWSGAGETKKPIPVPERLLKDFKLVFHEEFDLKVPFTRESWNGRMKACRGVGASLPLEQVKDWEKEHRALLERIAPEKFEILHYGALAGLQVRN